MLKLDDNKINDGLYKLALILMAFFAGIGLVKTCHSCNKLETPVKKVVIDDDTNRIISDSIIELNAREYEEAVEIKNLDNDSTVKLFYKLIQSE